MTARRRSPATGRASTSAGPTSGPRPGSTGWTRSTPSPSASTTTRTTPTTGVLMVNNDDIVAPGTGFETHPHRDMEIVTWVLQGSLVHQDSTGHNGLIYPGLAQRMSAGTGILHSEKNDSWRQVEAATRHRPRALRADVGAAGRVRDHPRLRAARDRRRPARRRAGAGGVRDGQARGRHRDPDPQQVRRPARRAAAARPVGRAARGAVPAPVRRLAAAVTLEGAGPLGEGDAVRLTATGGQRVSADRAGGDPGLGDARRARAPEPQPQPRPSRVTAHRDTEAQS